MLTTPTLPTLDAPLGPWLKGFPLQSDPLTRSQVAAAGWHLLDGPLNFPVAVLRQAALQHNLGWMQGFARAQGLDLAPHGKTTLSPELFQAQLEAGAWGITFANVRQWRVGLAAGVQNALIANQLVAADDLLALMEGLAAHPACRAPFWMDSLAQLQQVEQVWQRHATEGFPALEVLIEMGEPGGRSGCRTQAQALDLARALRQSPSVRLVGVSCYEGLGVTGDSAEDTQACAEWGQRVQDLALALEAEQLWETDVVLITAGGSALFDLIAPHLRPRLSTPVRGLLRSGCYLTHDDGHYQRMVNVAHHRMGCDRSLEAALEVWAVVQSCPEPGLALLAAGKRDLGHDMGLPRPRWWVRAGQAQRIAAPTSWVITKMNDQHAYLRCEQGAELALQVGDRVGLGISHPCSTFDRWPWMAVIDEQDRVVDAITTRF